MKLKFRCLHGKFGVCRLPANAAIPAWSQTGPLSSITRTNQELSVVCPEESVPPQQACEGGWICLKLEGPFSFSEVGIWRRLLILYGMRECQFLRFRRTTRITCWLKRRSVEQPWMHCGKRGMS